MSRVYAWLASLLTLIVVVRGGMKYPAIGDLCTKGAEHYHAQLVERGMYSKINTSELEQLVDAYANTSAMRQLAAGWVGEVEHPKAKELYEAAVKAATHVLRICTEGGGLVKVARDKNSWTVPEVPQWSKCGERKLHVIALHSHPIKSGASTRAAWGSFLMRGLPLPAYMITKGHNASWYSESEHARLFSGCLTDPNFKLPFEHDPKPDLDGVHTVALIIKMKPESIVKCLQKFKIPIVLDTVDSGLDYDLFKGYQLIMASNRLAAQIMEANTGVRSVPLYHQPCNYERFHRADRRSPVRVIGMTHQPHNHALSQAEMANALEKFCKENKITFRLGDYSGHGYDQEEMRQFLMAKHDWGAQIGYAMGYSSVDIGVIWLACHVPELICVKPTTRVAMYLSLGIPTVFIATASYMDIVVKYGYPFAATDVKQAMEMVELLVGDAEMRQAASEIGLRAAERFHLDTIAEEAERALCEVAEQAYKV